MIRKLSIENCRSIKDKIEISFLASPFKDMAEYENTFSSRKDNVLKCLAFYDANAAGKSTIFNALQTLKDFVTQKELYEVPPYYPYLLDNDSKNKDTSILSY